MEKSKNNSAESDVYVKIDSLEAAEAKKNLLEVTASIINMQMLSEKIKRESKTGVRQSSEIKGSIKSMNLLLNHLTAELPKLNFQKSTLKEIEEKIPGETFSSQKSNAGGRSKNLAVTRSKKNSLNEELLEIKRKLADLK